MQSNKKNLTLTMAQENKSVYNGVFKWNDDEKELLIDEFETDIGKFMNKLMPQAKLWRDLAERMRNSPIFSEKKKLLLNSGICQRRWLLLRNNFKTEFFDNSRTDYEKDESVPKLFYCKLQHLYKNYVMSKVNETFSSEQFGNKSVDMNVDMNSSIKSLLNADEAMIKVLTINNDNASKIPSQTQIAIKKIEALPKGEVFIERFKTRIDPNTPLNRNNSYHTQQQSQKILTRTKLILNDKEPKQSFLKIPPQSANKNKHDLTIIYPNYETTDLNTCDLSDINQGETSSCYIQNKTNSINVPIELGFSTTSEALKYSDHQYLDNTTIEVEKVDNVGTSKKRIKIELPIMYLPSTSRLNHDQQVKKELSLNDKPRVYVVKKFNPALPISILPKPKVQLPETTSASDWQFKFMKKYEADMKNLNDKVDKIFRQVSQNTSTTVIKRMPPKRESSEDIY